MSKNNTQTKRLEAKDLIAVAIYAAILAVISMVVSFTMFIPIFILISAFLIPLIDGIPFMLFVTKIKKFGMVTLLGTLAGIINCFTGMGIYAIITGVIFGLLADLILKSGNYKSKSKTVLGYAVYSLWTIGNYIPIIFFRDAYYQNLLEGGMTQEYLDGITKFIPDWSLIVIVVISFVGGILGSWIGMKMHKKHFERAGITA